MSMIEGLVSKRVFNIFVPDVTLAQAQKNEPYVLKIVTPQSARFLEVVQISSPFDGLGLPGNNSQIAYAFLCDPEEVPTRNFYITAVFSEMPFPWHNDLHSDYYGDIVCHALGISVHNGVPLLHVETDVDPKREEEFEKQLTEYGYKIIPAKPYTQAASLVELMKVSQRGGTSGSPST